MSTPTVAITVRLTREERAARLRSRAARKAAEASHLRTKNDTLLGVMNGTPVLRGHHSEGRHRRDLKRIDNDFRKSFEAAKEAESLERRALAAEQNRTISSDDADAIEQLRAKLARKEEDRAQWKAINACLRRPGAEVALLAMGISQIRADELTRPDFSGNIGVPSYAVTNASAECRRLAKRIAELEKAAAAPARPAETFGAVTVDEAGNRVRIAFPGRPAAEVIVRLKRNGFRWAPSIGMWQRQANSIAWMRAREIAELGAA